ncbi:GPP34 family phosphoprotein [Streptomyces sp. NBC_01216]|uniref:GOLPH3/VPS74 family protein n=1 Tax=unclassified Streptomyces TaxID=2593676 RepID=UPI002E0F95CF|nr:GPP34 family phosphoprotein [Streptomyces sp. NBC_01216]
MAPSPATPLSLPARLVLAAHADRRLRSRMFRTELGYGAAGAALLELAAEERISVSHEAIVVRDARRDADPVVDRVLGQLLFADRGRGPRRWVERLGPTVLDGTRDRLIADGLLVPVRRRILGVFPVRGDMPAGTPAAPDHAVVRLLDALRRPGAAFRPECPGAPACPDAPGRADCPACPDRVDLVVPAVRAAVAAAALPFACSG